jgi:hypothetical protein
MEKDPNIWGVYRPSLHPCSIEAFSYDEEENDNKSILLCGQYELDESEGRSGSRGGKIDICTVDSETKSLSITTSSCESGVLDMKVSGGFVATAHSANTLCVQKMLRSKDSSG